MTFNRAVQILQQTFSYNHLGLSANYIVKSKHSQNNWHSIQHIWISQKKEENQAAGGLISSQHGGFLKAYPQSDPCGCSSSSGGTAAPSSCLSYSGSRTEVSPAVLLAPPGTPWRPAWHCAPCRLQTSTGAWYGSGSCTGCSGCTFQTLSRSPGVHAIQEGPAPNHTQTHLHKDKQRQMNNTRL